MNTEELKRCKYCGHLLDAASDNRDMAIDVIGHGKRIYQFLLAENIRSIDICNFCYTHLSFFRKEHPTKQARQHNSECACINNMALQLARPKQFFRNKSYCYHPAVYRSSFNGLYCTTCRAKVIEPDPAEIRKLFSKQPVE